MLFWSRRAACDGCFTKTVAGATERAHSYVLHSVPLQHPRLHDKHYAGLFNTSRQGFDVTCTCSLLAQSIQMLRTQSNLGMRGNSLCHLVHTVLQASDFLEAREEVSVRQPACASQTASAPPICRKFRGRKVVVAIDRVSSTRPMFIRVKKGRIRPKQNIVLKLFSTSKCTTFRCFPLKLVLVLTRCSPES